MRISRTTTLLLVANLIALAFVWRSSSQQQPYTATQTQLFPPDVARIVLTEGSARITLERRATGWRLLEPFDWTANIWSVQRLLDELHFGTERGFDVKEAMANGSSLKDYGLDPPRWSLKVTGVGGATVEARIGLQPSTRNHFLLTADGQRIVPLPEALAAALASPADSYRVDKIFEITDFEARSVSVRRRMGEGETVTALTLEARPRIGRRVQIPEWHFEAPFDMLSDVDATAQAVAELTQLRASRFVELTETVTGLASPSLRIAVEGNSRRQVLLVGNPAPDQPAQLCAKLEDNPAVFLIEARFLRDWIDARETLVDSRAVDFDPALVTGFTVTVGGRSLTLHRLEGGGEEPRWEIPVVPGSTATKRREGDARRISRFLSGLAQLRAARKPAGADSKLTVPAVVTPANPAPAGLPTVELEFGAERITLTFMEDPSLAAGMRVVHAKGAPLAAICQVSLLDGGFLNVEPQAWRRRAVAVLPQGARVSGLRLTAIGENKVLGEARLGNDGKWTGSGQLQPAMAKQVALGCADIRAEEFLSREVGAGPWAFELQVTDQSASGNQVPTESIRTYQLSAPLDGRRVLMRDVADQDSFIVEANFSALLAGLLAEASR